MGLLASKNTYSASSSPAKVNGADVRMQVKAEGSGKGSFMFSAMVIGAGVASFDGPFSWRLEAVGQEGRQESLIVHRVLTETEKTKRKEWYPQRYLGQIAKFKPQKDQPGSTRALYQIPGLLKVMPREDGALRVTVDLTVVAHGRRESKRVRFRMDPTKTRQDEFIFIPTEIINNFGKSMDEWEEPNWDR